MAKETSDTSSPTERSDPLWFKDAIIYQLHVKAFYDSNGDGIGDFRGLTEKLDYVKDLGVNTVWLLPFYPSPLKDDGYDIAAYSDVHPDYGTVAEFRNFLREAHRRNLKVITELVINHTSDQHPWFQAARRAPAGSNKRNYYVWSDTDQRWPETRIIFTDTESSNWAWDPVAKAYYWHRFFSHQPDLNFDNPSVVKAVMRVMRFLARHGCGRHAPRCHSLPVRARWHEQRESSRDARRAQTVARGARSPLSEAASSWPKRTNGRRTCTIFRRRR
jgi:maltose alpha-D-glucosyltransferase/alpha-amylase